MARRKAEKLCLFRVFSYINERAREEKGVKNVRTGDEKLRRFWEKWGIFARKPWSSEKGVRFGGGSSGKMGRREGEKKARWCKKRYFRRPKAYRVRSFGNSHFAYQKRNITFALRTLAPTDASPGAQSERTIRFFYFCDRPRSTPVCTTGSSGFRHGTPALAELPPTRTS